MGVAFTLIVGSIMGCISVLSMVLKHMDRAKCWSGFFLYIVVTFIIFNTNLPQLNIHCLFVGPLVSLLILLPVLVLIYKEEKKIVPFMLANAIALGFLISVIVYYKQDIANMIYSIAPFLW